MFFFLSFDQRNLPFTVTTNQDNNTFQLLFQCLDIVACIISQVRYQTLYAFCQEWIFRTKTLICPKKLFWKLITSIDECKWKCKIIFLSYLVYQAMIAAAPIIIYIPYPRNPTNGSDCMPWKLKLSKYWTYTYVAIIDNILFNIFTHYAKLKAYVLNFLILPQ